MLLHIHVLLDSKVHGVKMGSIWGRQDPGGPHVGPMNFAIWAYPHAGLLNLLVKLLPEPNPVKF